MQSKKNNDKAAKKAVQTLLIVKFELPLIFKSFSLLSV